MALKYVLAMVDHGSKAWLTMALKYVLAMVDHGSKAWLTMVKHGSKWWSTMVILDFCQTMVEHGQPLLTMVLWPWL